MSIAAEKGNIEELKYWLSQGTNINQRDVRGMTPLHFSAKEGFIEAVKFLVENNANKYEKDSEGRTALHLAASEGKIEMVKYLYKECGLDIDEQDWRGLTPLHLGNIRLIQIIIKCFYKAYI